MILKKHLAITLLLFLSVCLHAQVQEKQITVSFSNIPLQEAMKRVEKASGYTFFYDAKQIDLKQKVSLTVNNAPISEALLIMFRKIDIYFEGTSLQIVLIDKTKKPQTGHAIPNKGKVFDYTDEPMTRAKAAP